MIVQELDTDAEIETTRASRPATSPQLLCIAGFDGRFKSVSASWEVALDYSSAELRSRSFYEFIHPDDVALTMNVVRQLASGWPEDGLQNRFRRRDGTYRRVLWAAEPIVKDHVFFAVASDVTGVDERLIKRYLRESMRA